MAAVWEKENPVPLWVWEHLVIQNRAVTDKPAGHCRTPGIESNSYFHLIQIVTDKLKMSPDKGSKKPPLVSLDFEGVKVRDKGVRVGTWVWLHYLGNRTQMQYPAVSVIILYSLICIFAR